MIRQSILISLLACGLSAPAFAGSMAPPVVEAPVTPPVVVMGHDWTGFYLGANLGWSQFDLGAGTADGVAYGLQAGYNYDFGTYVVGAEVEYQDRNFWDDTDPASTRGKLRLGYDMGDALPYITGGFSSIDSQSGYNIGVGVEYMFSPVVGIGAEYLYENISDFDDTSVDLTANTIAARLNYHF